MHTNKEKLMDTNRTVRRDSWWKVIVLIVGTGLLYWVTAKAAFGAGMLVADGGLGGALDIKEHNVRVTINNGVAVTEVTQVFVNTEDRVVEALYTFPVPKGASVANFSMWINGKEMVGEVLEKKKAREIYNSYKAVQRDPGLLEQVNYRTFEMRIFPIGPKAEQKVQVVYYQELDFDHDWATYVYPLATVTRKDVNTRVTGKFSMAVDVKSEVPIAAMESPSHAKDFAIAKHTETYSQASLETTGGSLGRDVVVAYHLSRAHTGIDVIASRTAGEDGYFMLTLTAGEEAAPKAVGMDYVFVQDISGSMGDDGKLDLSRACVGAFVKSLGADDRFELLTFNVQAEVLFRNLTAAGDESKARAMKFIEAEQARGGTALRPALETAYKYADGKRAMNIVIVSDGLTDQQERALLVQMIKSRPANTRVFCIGLGNDVNRGLLEQLAEDAGGLAAFISREDNFERQAQGFRRKLMRPVATDVKIDLAGADVYDLEPRRLPNLYHGAPIRLYGRYKQAGETQVTLHGRVGDVELNRTVTIALPKEEADNPQIERMWAWHKVQRLLKEADAEGPRSTSTINEIIRLGEGYSIATEYTSFLVLENDAEFQRWQIKRRNALRMERDRASQQQLAAQFEAMRNKAAADIGPEAVQAISVIAQAPMAQQPGTPTASPASPRSRNVDFGLPGGGGALDPISVGIAVGLGVVALAARRGKRGSGGMKQ